MQETDKRTGQDFKHEGSSLSFKDLFYKYIRFSPLFVLSVALALLVAYMYLRYAIPAYSVNGSLLIKSEKASGRGDKFEDLFINDKAQNILSEIEILKSKPLMTRVVNRLNLQQGYYVSGKIKKSINIYKQAPFAIIPISLKDSGSSFSMSIKFVSANTIKIEKGPDVKIGNTFKTSRGIFTTVANGGGGTDNGDYTFIWRSPDKAAQEFTSLLNIVPKTPGTGILKISMITENSLMGADIINTLMEEYRQYTIEQKKQSSDQILTFIDDRLSDYGRKLDSVQRLYKNYMVANKLFNEEAQMNSYFEVISTSDNIANEEAQKVEVAGMIDDYLADRKNSFSKILVPSSLGLMDVTLNELIQTYNKAQLERQQLLESNIPVNNPVVIEATAQIEKLRVNIRENLKNIKSAVNVSVNKSRSRSLSGQDQLQLMPQKMIELAELKRQVETVGELFKMLQQQKEQTAISRASTISGSEIIDRASPTDVPVKPNKRAIQLLAILAGLALPTLFIFMSELLNDKVTTRNDIERLTDTPILGEIGHSFSDGTLVVSKTSRSMVAEQFRIVRSNLQFVLQKKEKAVILVTSSFSGEGKSYVSTNMGAVLALAGKKTIILEFDIRKPKVLSGLKIPKGPGITNYLVGKVDDLQELIKPIPDYENLFVLGCGPIPPNPAELLLDSRLDDLFDWAKANFDIVMIDTAPVGMVSDAMILGRYADSTMYLVRQGHTFKKQIGLIDEFYKSNKLPRLSIIINDVKLKPGYGYYGHGRYGYGYGYGDGSYYEEEVNKKSIFNRIISIFDIRRFFKKS